MGYTILTGIWEEVSDECQRQRQLHGAKCIEDTPTSDAVPILGEEFGEVCKAVLEYRDRPTDITWKHLREELIQLAASSVSMIRHLENVANGG